MLFDNYFKHIICEESIENVYFNGKCMSYKLDIRMPSYRGTYLSCLREFSVLVDGKEIDSKSILFCLNGKKFLLSKLPELNEEYWFVRDKASIEVSYDGGLSIGDHEIQVNLSHVIPYTGYDGDYKIDEGHDTKTVSVQ